MYRPAALALAVALAAVALVARPDPAAAATPADSFEPVPFAVASTVAPPGAVIVGTSYDADTCQVIYYWSDGTETRFGESCLPDPPPAGETALPGSESDITIADPESGRRVQSDPEINAPVEPAPEPDPAPAPDPAPVVGWGYYRCGSMIVDAGTWAQTAGGDLSSLDDCELIETSAETLR